MTDQTRHGGFALGAKKRTPQDKQQRDAITTLVRLGWGQNNPAFRRMFAEMMVPGAADKQMAFFDELQRRTATPETAARYLEVTGDFDVTHLAGRVTAPRSSCIHETKQLFRSRPGANWQRGQVRWAPGREPLFLEHEPAAQRFFEEIEVFLGC
jgi:hypothetical protein